MVPAALLQVLPASGVVMPSTALPGSPRAQEQRGGRSPLSDGGVHPGEHGSPARALLLGLTGLVVVAAAAAILLLSRGPAGGVVQGLLGGLQANQAGAYRQEVLALLGQYDSAWSASESLLAERDADPTVVLDPTWMAQQSHVIGQFEAIYRGAQAIRVPARYRSLHDRLLNGLRMTLEGEVELYQAFQSDGHAAYYFASHGNWNLNLGRQAVNQCRAELGG